jgi:hypothetical protein
MMQTELFATFNLMKIQLFSKLYISSFLMDVQFFSFLTLRKAPQRAFAAARERSFLVQFRSKLPPDRDARMIQFIRRSEASVSANCISSWLEPARRSRRWHSFLLGQGGQNDSIIPLPTLTNPPPAGTSGWRRCSGGQGSLLPG